MIKQTGTIIGFERGQIQIEITPVNQCQSCSQGKGCGALTLSKAFGHKAFYLSVPYAGQAHVQQKVQLGFSEQRLLLASMLVYVAPLLVLVLSVLIAPVLLSALQLQHEGWLIGVSLLLTTMSVVTIKKGLELGWFGRFDVSILRLLPPASSVAKEQIPICQQP